MLASPHLIMEVSIESLSSASFSSCIAKLSELSGPLVWHLMLMLEILSHYCLTHCGGIYILLLRQGILNQHSSSLYPSCDPNFSVFQRPFVFMADSMHSSFPNFTDYKALFSLLFCYFFLYILMIVLLLFLVGMHYNGDKSKNTFKTIMFN